MLAWLIVSASSALAWETRLAGTGNGTGDALAVAVAPGGDVIAAGHVNEADTAEDFVVVRLGAADGAEQWRTVLAGPSAYDEARAVIVNASGDVVVAGATSDPVLGDQFLVVKLAGATGAVRWRYDLPGGEANAVLSDVTGDVYAAGTASIPPPVFGSATTVVKLAGDTGLPVWTFQDPLGTGAESAALLPGQDVVVSELFNSTGRCCSYQRQVIRLDHTTGTPVWSTLGPSLSVSYPDYRQNVGSLAATPGGDVFAVALGTSTGGGVLRLAGKTGALQWTRTLTGSPEGSPAGSFVVSAIAVTGGGDLAVFGTDAVVECIPVPFPSLVGLRMHLEVLAQADGATVTDHVIPAETAVGENPCLSGSAWGVGLTLAPSGDAYVVGSFGYGTFGPNFFAARLNAPDLHEAWRRSANEFGVPRVPGPFVPETVSGPSAGSILVGGSTAEHLGTPSRFAVLALDAGDGSPRTCGDATTGPGEACDDGTLGEGTCCSADCKSAQPDGATCDDGSVCTLGDRCVGGGCYGTSRLPCEPCGVCNDAFGCFANVANDCGRPTVTDGAAVAIARTKSGRAQFEWTLRSGPATSIADLGDPLTDTGYAVCGMDSDGRVVLRAVAPAAKCGGRACWRRTRRGFEYFDPRAPDGLSRLSLRAGDGGRSRFHASGGRKQLLAPELPLDGGITVELLRTDQPSMCWSADHETVVKNNTHRFRAKGS
jgi:outer membrane protein assembly factor BamB